MLPGVVCYTADATLLFFHSSAQVKVFVTGLFSLNQDIPAFKEHLRDFLVQIKVSLTLWYTFVPQTTSKSNPVHLAIRSPMTPFNCRSEQSLTSHELLSVRASIRYRFYDQIDLNVDIISSYHLQDRHWINLDSRCGCSLLIRLDSCSDQRVLVLDIWLDLFTICLVSFTVFFLFFFISCSLRSCI